MSKVTMWRSRWRCVIKPAYSFSFLLSINIFQWQNVLYFLDAPRISECQESLSQWHRVIHQKNRVFNSIYVTCSNLQIHSTYHLSLSIYFHGMMYRPGCLILIPDITLTTHRVGSMFFLPETTLSRRLILCTASYVTWPPCSASTSSISSLTCCWMSWCIASRSVVKDSRVATISKPAVKKTSACAAMSSILRPVNNKANFHKP